MAVRRTRLTRPQILAHRLRAGALDRRRVHDEAAIRLAAHAGLQDSMPRAAVLSLHARIDDIGADDWAHPSLVQVWGPRFNAYVVPASGVAAFTLGRLPRRGPMLRRAESTAEQLEGFLEGSAMTYRAAGEGLGVDPNSLRYAALTGRVRLRWEGAGQPTVWMVDPPAVAADEARVDLLRRYLHVFGPASVESFSKWAGIKAPEAVQTFDRLSGDLHPVETPTGPAWMLPDDVAAARGDPQITAASVRLLPSGDAHFLRWGTDREVLVPDGRRRDTLWTPRVWPGALLADGEIAGTWRRAGATVELTAWRRLTRRQRDAAEMEAASLPVPDRHGTIEVRWSS